MILVGEGIMSNEVKIEIFDDLNSYYKKKARDSTMTVTKADFKRYAISTGGFSNYTPNQNGVHFYEHLVDMALEENKSRFHIGKSYASAERTIQTSVSFFLGMISAKCLAEKKYKIGYLFHLNDPMLQVLTDGKSPDFFGISNTGQAFIMEAKGTTKNKLSKTTVNNGKEQVDSVIEIELETNTGLTLISDFKRHIVGSCFQNKQLTVQDIDPMGENKRKGLFAIKEIMYLNYYRNVKKFISDNRHKVDEYNGRKYAVLETNSSEIGLDMEMFNVLESYSSFYDTDRPYFSTWELVHLWNEVNDKREDKSISKDYLKGIYGFEERISYQNDKDLKKLDNQDHLIDFDSSGHFNLMKKEEDNEKKLRT